METQNPSVNRAIAGLIALGCLVTAIGLIPWVAGSNSLSLLQGGLVRGGLLMGAFWLAMPGRNREAAWAKLTPKTVIIVIVAVFLTSKIKPIVFVPAAVVVTILIVILRPRPKKRPSNQFPG